MKNNPLIVIIGPTAVGKTEIAIQLARRLDGEIVSADSRLFYIGMDVGTAKPTKVELSLVPHHLIDVAAPNEIWSLAKYQQEAQHAITDILSRKRIPFLVGGSGQYIRAVLEGWSIPRVEPNHGLRKALENWVKTIGSSELHDRLAILDPIAAGSIDHRNIRRVIRALEVIFLTGHPFSAQRNKVSSPYQSLVLGLDRPRTELYERIDSRIINMIDAGLIAEVCGLLEQGFSPDMPAFSAIGYGQAIKYLDGVLTKDDMVNEMKRLTRQFVRRQANWFKSDDPNIHWFLVESNTVDELGRAIIKFLDEFI